MGRNDAIKVLKERISLDNLIPIKGMPKEFVDFMAKQKQALEYAIDFLNNPLTYMTEHELILASHKYDHICDIEDLKKEVENNFEYYDEKFGIKNHPVKEDEFEAMSYLLRDILDNAYDEAWSGRCEFIVKLYLSQRRK